MAECRICFNSVKGNLISPCHCSGSIKHIHPSCLKQWLKEKYPSELKSLLQSKSKTGIHCELCKFELKLNPKCLRPLKMIEKVRKSWQTYSVLINIPVILFLVYKSSNFLHHLFLFLYSLTLKLNKPQNISERLSRLLHIQLELFSKALPMSLACSILPLFLQSTWKLLRSLWLECLDVQIENLV
jgi:hypothetical protein